MFIKQMALMFLFLVPSFAYADSRHIGTINLYHLASYVPGRGVCVKMTPSLPGTTWACLEKSNPLYDEITALFMMAFNRQSKCQISWDVTTVEGHALIEWAECSP